MTQDRLPTRIAWSNINPNYKKEKPEPIRYRTGTIFETDKFIDTDKTKVRGRTRGRIWKSPDFGWVYGADYDEPVQTMDNNWVRSFTKNGATHDKELDEYFKTHKQRTDWIFYIKWNMIWLKQKIEFYFIFKKWIK